MEVEECTAVLSPKLTWFASSQVKVQRSESDEGPWTDVAEFPAGTGSLLDTPVPAGKARWYRVADGEHSGEPVKVVGVRKLSTDGYTVISDGDFTVSDWGKPPSNAFSGSLARDFYPDGDPKHSPKIGIDFGEATNFVAHMRIYPRHDAEYRGRVRDVVFSGSDYSGERIMGEEYMDSFGTPLTAPLVDKYGYLGWYNLPVANPAAYRTYFISRWSNNGF